MRSFVIFLLVLTTNIRPLRSEINDISLGIGLIDENIKTYQTNTAGDRNFAEYRILIESQLYYDIFDDDQWFIVPTLAFQFPKTTEESSIKKYRFITAAAVGYSALMLQAMSSASIVVGARTKIRKPCSNAKPIKPTI